MRRGAHRLRPGFISGIPRMIRHLTSRFALLQFFALPLGLAAQVQQTGRTTQQASRAVAQPASDPDPTGDPAKRLHWRSVGPANNAGRISVVVGVPGNRDVYY